MTVKTKYILVLILCLFTILNSFQNVQAQQTAIGFKHISYKDGLFQSPLVAVLQDKSGYVWLGSWNGLSRYDGVTFRNFRQSDLTDKNISHNRINKIYEDHKGELWIGTGGGLNLYNRKTETFLHVGLSNGKGGGNFIAALESDNSGVLWVSTFKGIKYVNRKKNTLENVPLWEEQGEDELYKGVSFALFLDNQQTIWAGIKHGLKRFDPRTKKVIPLPEVLLNNKELIASKIVVINQDQAGNIWFGTEESGLFKYNAQENTCTRYLHLANYGNSLPSNWINDILIKGDEIWIATRNGLAIFNGKNNTFANYNHDSANSRSISDDSVWSFMKDRSGNIWIGTYSGGINIYYPGNMNFSNIGERIGTNVGLNKPLANAIVEDKGGALWIGTFGGGLNYIDREKGIVRYYSVVDAKNRKFSNEVKAIVNERSGKLWIGTLDGLCTFNTNTSAIKYFDLEILNNKTGAKLINTLVSDSDGLWVGTNGGGLRFINDEGRELKSFMNSPDQQHGLSDNYVNALLNDGNQLWVATQNGLNRYDKANGKFTVFKRIKQVGLGNNNVLCLFKDSKQRLWIGTDGGGLNCLDPKTSKIYSIKQTDGLVDEVVNSIVEDNSGKLWISTSNGLSQISFNAFKFPLKAADYKIANYTSANGLSGNQFLANAGIKTSKGEILFGGMNGVTAFFPEKIVKNTYKPDMLLTGILVKNKELEFGSQSPLKYPVNEVAKLTLPHSDNNITLKFSTLNFINPEKNTYAYKMTGLQKNDDWFYIGNKKEASFTNLAPGKYTFSVKAANNDGVWNNVARNLEIVILPPLWQTWWAYLLYVIILGFMAYKIIQFFKIRAGLERDLYNEHLQNERQQEFYKMKLDFFTNISHEIRTPLTLILGPLENLYKRTQEDSVMKGQVLQIKNNAERLMRLITELMDFRKTETGNMVLYLQKDNIVPFIKEIYLSFQQLAESRNIQYEFIAPKTEIMLYSDRNHLEKVFFNLLSNAFKFTPEGGHIKLEVVEGADSFLTVKITDNGKGIPLAYQHKLFTSFYQVQPDQSQPGTGVGLALSKSIIELHNGFINVESRPAAPGVSGSTIFTVKLPYNLAASDTAHRIQAGPDPQDITSFQLQSELDVLTYSVFEEQHKNYTILLAEDNEELRTFIAESLPGYQIISCVNGADAFEQATNNIPDLIISDIMMPVMDGLELCRKVKTDERTSHIPVILLTALAAHIHQVNGFQTGADTYLTKPFSTKILELNVHNLLSSRELMRKKFAQQITLQPQNLPITSPDEKFIKKLMQVVEDHMENPEFGVVALGNEMGMSKTVLYKKICAVTDMAPADFIKSMRLKKAAFLLQQNVLSINEVAVLVGFNDRKYFSREFKKLHGVSPSALDVS